MSQELLVVRRVGRTAAVVVALFLVMRWARPSQPEAKVAIVARIRLAFWAITATVLACRGAFLQCDPYSVPPIAAYLGVVLIGFALHMVPLWQLLDRPWTEVTIGSAPPFRSGY
jgi:hypothetical protein